MANDERDSEPGRTNASSAAEPARVDDGAFRAEYRRHLKGGELEFAAGVEQATPVEIDERVDAIRGQLLRIVDSHLDGDPDARELVGRLVSDGALALRMLGNDDSKLKQGTKHASDLEAIIRSDGSRPSFLIRNGEVDLDSSPIGSWKDSLAQSAERLTDPIACVGRIDLDGIHEGTGFLVGDDVVCTNRHVLQAIAVQQGKKWELRPRVSIDFGQEFRGQDSLDRREAREVLFSGVDTIGDPIDYKKLDLVLLRVSASASGKKKKPLSVDIAPDWAESAVDVYVMGYAAKPIAHYQPSVLELLFKVTWGKKRLAPGSASKPRATQEGWTFAHDATTLNGNSGSVVLVAGREHMAAGIHFGGRRGEPAENWGHIFGLTLRSPDMTTGRTLKDCFDGLGVTLLDRL